MTDCIKKYPLFILYCSQFSGVCSLIPRLHSPVFLSHSVGEQGCFSTLRSLVVCGLGMRLHSGNEATFWERGYILGMRLHSGNEATYEVYLEYHQGLFQEKQNSTNLLVFNTAN